MQAEHNMYSEAILCLEQTMIEGQKVANVDIQMMWLNIQKCRNIIQQLSVTEQDPFYAGILYNLERTLSSNIEILQSKILQLNNGNTPGGDNHTIGGGETKLITIDDNANNVGGTGDSHKNRRSSAIEDTLVTKGGITFNDIAGLQEAKKTLREAIIMPLHFPHLFTGGIKPWKRILLYGPPGTGKSRIAQAISSEISSCFYCVSSSDLVSSWVGESEKLIKELFHHATNQDGRSVIFIDEIDSICRQRNSREEEYTRRIKTELLKQMEGADNSTKADKLFLLCATNCPWELDTAFLRRFQKRIYIPLPEKEARIDLMKIHTKDNSLTFSEEEWDQLGEMSEGFSGSDIANMVLEALFGPIRDLQMSSHWKPATGVDGFVPCDKEDEGSMEMGIADIPPEKVIPRSVALKDFLNSVKTHRQTVSETELAKFDDFTNKFGETG